MTVSRGDFSLRGFPASLLGIVDYEAERTEASSHQQHALKQPERPLGVPYIQVSSDEARRDNVSTRNRTGSQGFQQSRASGSRKSTRIWEKTFFPTA